MNEKATMLDEAYKQILVEADKITPQETVAFMTATLYGMDCVPDEYQQHLAPATQKLACMGWLLYTQIMAAKTKQPQKKTAKKRTKKTAKKK